MAEFFIRRPIVAIVIAIITVMMGTYSLLRLSFEQYPFLAPPTIRVTANYSGASAVAVEQSVATPIEQEVNGVDRMIYMKSSNTSDGRMLLDVNFEVEQHAAVAGVRRLHVDHPVDAVDLLLDRRGHGLLDRHRRGARIVGGHADGRRRQERILLEAEPEERVGAHHDGDDGD